MDVKRRTLQHDFAPEWLKLPNQISTAVRSSDQILNRSLKPDAVKNDVTSNKKSVYSSRQESPIQLSNGSRNGYTRLAHGRPVDIHQGVRLNELGKNSNKINGVHTEKTSGNSEHKSNTSDREVTGMNKDCQPSPTAVSDDVGNWNASSMESTANDNIHFAVDEEFPSLVGEVLPAADSSKPAFSRGLSVWDGTSREFSAASWSTKNTEDKVMAVKAPSQKSSSGKRAASDIVEIPASNSKTLAGQRANGRKMTVLTATNGKDRQKEPNQQPTLSLMNSVGKVITHELEDRKCNYMKLVRRENHECNENITQTESYAVSGDLGSTSDISCKDLPVDVDSRQKLYEQAEYKAHSGDMVSNMTPTDSSLMFSDEDERRLLCSMGWEECTDEENYELTEAEIAEVITMIKEKQKLTEQIKRANGCAKIHLVQKFTFDNRSRSHSAIIH